MTVLNCDSTLRFLAESHVNQIQVPKDKLVSELGKLRSNFSYQWLSKFKDNDCEKSLAVVLNLIFRYADHQESNVRLGAYSALGGLLMLVAPFVPHQFIAAFATATAPLPTSPKISIAVINSFVYLTRFVSPVRTTEFVSRLQVLTHFSVDMTENLKYLPQIIPLMINLPVQFHQNILRSLISKCGRSPNAAFVASVVSLIETNPKMLLSLTVDFLKQNNLFAAATLLGSNLLKKRVYFDMLDESGKCLFFDSAINAMKREQLELSSFESACRICSLFLNYSREKPDDYKKYNDIVQEAIKRDFTPVYKVRLYCLPTPIEELKDDPKDNDQVRAAKLQSLAQYFLFNEDCDPDVVADMFLKQKAAENDLYCVLVESFALCIRRLIKTCKKRFHLQLLEFILRKKNKNWVHDEAVTKIIDELDAATVPRHVDLALDKLIEFSLSSNDRLCETAIKSFVKFSTYDNLDNILQRLMWSDWLDDRSAQRRFRLLAKLAKVFKSPLFSQFIPIAYEAIELYNDTRVASYAYLFLSRITVNYIPNRVRDFTFKYVIKHFNQYTHKVIDGPLRRYLESPLETPFLEGVDTDIVANPVLSHKKALKHVMNAYAFLCSLDVKLLVDIESLFWVSLALVPVFDKFALDEATTLYVLKPGNFVALWNLNNEIFLTTSQDDVAASCLSLIIRSGREPIPQVIDICERFLTDNLTSNTDLLFFCYVIIDQVDHELSVSALETILKRLSVFDQNSFLYKVLHISSNLIIKLIKDETGFALLEFSNEQGGKYDERVEKCMEITPFNEWNVTERPLRRNLITYLERTKKVRKVTNPETFDDEHWKFLMDFIQYFETEELRNYITANPRRFAKIDVTNLIPKTEETKKFPQLKPINNTVIATAAPFFLEGKMVKEVALIRSFFENSNQQVDDKMFMKAFEYCESSFDINSMNAVLDYAKRVNKKMEITVIQKHMIVLTDRVFPHFIKCFTADGFIESLAPEIKEKIERKLQAKIEPSLILQYQTNKNIASIIETDPKYFIKYFDSEPDYKAKQLVPVIALIQSHLLPKKFIYNTALRLILSFNEMQTTKKIGTFLRFLSVSLAHLANEPRSDEYKQFSGLLNENLPNIIQTFPDAFSSDIGIILKTLIGASRTSIPFVEKFSKVPLNSARFLKFVESHAYIATRTQLQATTNNVISSIEHLFKTCHPTCVAAALRALSILVDTREPATFFPQVMKLIVPIMSLFPLISKVPFCCEDFSVLISNLLTHPMNQSLPPIFCERVKSLFLDHTSRASIQKSLSFATLLSERDVNLIQRLFQLNFDSPEVLSAIEESYQFVISNSQGDMGRVQKTLLNYAAERFIQFPTPRLGRFILQILRSLGTQIDAPRFLFVDLSKRVSVFYSMFSILGIFLLNASKEDAEKCASCVQQNTDTFSLMSRSQAIMLSCAGVRENIGLAFEMAACETEDVAKITEAYESFNK